MNETQNVETKEKNICSEANWVTNEQDLLFDLKCLIKEYYVFDLKCLIKEYYVATFTESGENLKLSFENGQSFLISVKSCN